jgi:hypothetical protein
MNPYAGRCGMLGTRKGNQQATPPGNGSHGERIYSPWFFPKRGVLRDYEQRG